MQFKQYTFMLSFSLFASESHDRAARVSDQTDHAQLLAMIAANPSAALQQTVFETARLATLLRNALHLERDVAQRETAHTKRATYAAAIKVIENELRRRNESAIITQVQQQFANE